MTDAELAALEQRMIAAAPTVIEHVEEPPPDGDAAQDGDDCDNGCADGDGEAGNT